MLKKKCMVCGNLIRDEDTFCRYHYHLKDQITGACCSICGKRKVAVIVGGDFYCTGCYRLTLEADELIIDAFAMGKDPEMEMALAFWRQYFA